MEIGLQLYSVRNALQQDYLATLEKVAGIGYKNVELISRTTENGLVFGEKMPPAAHRHLLEQLGLKATGCHVMPQEGMDWEKIIGSCLETGADSLVIPFSLCSNQEEVLAFCRDTNQAAELGQKQGVQFYYHNHFQEFQVFDGQAVMDIMLENMDPDLVKIEFDTYWAIRGGQDPIAWIRKLGARCDLLHQKDLPASVQPQNMFELLADNPDLTIQNMFETIGVDQFTEIGTGSINISAIIEAGRTYGGVRYMIVEQDMTAKDEMESVAISYKNLSALLADG